MARISIIFMVLLVGCAGLVVPVRKNSITIFENQSQPQAIEIPPPVPQLGITRVPQDVQLTWNPPPEPDAGKVVSYNIYVNTESDLWESTVISLGNVTNAVVTGLMGGTKYYFSVTDFGPDSVESDFAPIIGYIPNVVLDLRFAFNQPVTNVILQVSPDLVRWQDLGMIPTNGTWRVTVDPNIPMVIYRSAAQITP